MIAKPGSHNTIDCYVGNIRRYLIDRWCNCFAEEIESFEVEQRFNKISNNTKGEGVWHGTRCRSGSDYEAVILTPHETFAILTSLPLLQQIMVILDAATGLRYSEIAGLRWGDCDWWNNGICIRRTWSRGKVGLPKARKSEARVVIAPVLARYLRAWRPQNELAADIGWILTSHKTKGRGPRVGNMLASDCLRPAAIKGDVSTVIRETRLNQQEEETVKLDYWDKDVSEVRRFRFHNFRHCLASYLTTKKKTDVKTLQRSLPYSSSSITVDKYTQQTWTSLSQPRGRCWMRFSNTITGL